MSKRKCLIAYAMLQTAVDRGATNPVHAILPLIERSLKDIASGPTSLREISGKFKDLWGFELPVNVLRHCVRQHPVRNFIKYDQVEKSYHIEHPQSGVDQNYDAAEKLVYSKYEVVNSSIRLWTARESNLKISADEILYTWLASISPSFVTSLSGPTNLSFEEHEANRIINICLSSGSDDVRARFKNALTDIALGDLLYKSIVYASEYETLEALDGGRMSDVTVYLDTRILFWMLGYYGDDLYQASHELLQMCRATGCTVAVFTHNRDELHDGLMALAQAVGSPSRSTWEAVSYALAANLQRSDIIQAARSVDERLEGLGLEIQSPPERVEALGISESDLDYEIEIGVQQVNPMARMRDVRSVSAIFQMRGGLPIEYLEKSKAILITSNTSLAAAVTRHFLKEFRSEGLAPGVQICMTDIVFSARLWTKLPTNVGLAPREQILARSVSYLRPNHKLRESFIRRLEKLYSAGRVSEEYYGAVAIGGFVDHILALEHDSRTTDLTDTQVIETAKEAVREVQRLATSRAHSMIKTQTMEEVVAVRDEAEGKIAKIKSEMAVLTEALSNQGQTNNIIEKELRQLEADSRNLKIEYDQQIVNAANVRRKSIVVYATIMGSLLGVYMMSEFLPAGQWKNFCRIAVGAVGFLVTIVGVFGPSKIAGLVRGAADR
jgi:hypothetical protein